MSVPAWLLAKKVVSEHVEVLAAEWLSNDKGAAAEGTVLHGLRHCCEGHMDCDVWDPARIDRYVTEQQIFPACSGGRVGRDSARPPTKLV